MGSTFTWGLGGGSGTTGWQRPSDWLALPTVTAPEQKFVGLLAVYNSTANFVALRVRGAYTVDWGDGSAPENVADNTTAQHQYSYAALGAGTHCAQLGPGLLRVPPGQRHPPLEGGQTLAEHM